MMKKCLMMFVLLIVTLILAAVTDKKQEIVIDDDFALNKQTNENIAFGNTKLDQKKNIEDNDQTNQNHARVHREDR